MEGDQGREVEVKEVEEVAGEMGQVLGSRKQKTRNHQRLTNDELQITVCSPTSILYLLNTAKIGITVALPSSGFSASGIVSEDN